MNVRSIFIEALDFDEPRERSAYIDRACGGDQLLRARVEALLRRHQSDDELVRDRMPSVDPSVTEDVAQPVEEPGTSIGPYKLMEQIGEGGMGVVYVAEQHQPVRRKVALKIIKPGMDSRQVVARFEAERQALAMMDHPNIAKVHDGGTTPSGRPYFVMELVRGIPITEYCDRKQLSIPDRLELFVLVCRAVQHAHQKGIIHRDLKPSNILVTVIDGAAVPKVIDFGVAKATGAALTDRTVYTAFHQFVGTPLYMSPEQADLSGMDMDTRSDIYSLGVLLYELLTGTTPFDKETLRQVAFDEMRRIIREQEPPKPSTRLSSLGATRTTVSANRKVDARNLDRVVRGELDWIVMKALEKDRRRRYETASDFAADVWRYLDDEPVLACPPSAWYRFGKLARRHRVMLVTSSLVATALVLGTGLSTWQAHEAQRARRLADRLLVDEKQARGDAEVQRRRAQGAVDRAINRMTVLYSKFCKGVSGELPPETRRALADEIISFFQGIVNEKNDNKIVRFERAQAYLHLGRIFGWERKSDQFVAACEQAIAILEALTSEYPLETVHWQTLGQARNLLASHLMDAGHRLEAMREWREAQNAYLEAVKVNPLDPRGLGFLTVFLSTCPMGGAFLRAGRPEEAEAAYRDALAVLESLPPEIRDRPGVQISLAGLLATCPIPGLRNPARGVELARLAVERAPNSFTWNTLGVAEYRAGDCKAAINALEKSDAMEPDKNHKNVLAFNGFFLAMAHWQLGQKDPAYTWYDRSIEWIDKNQPWLDMNSGENEELERFRIEAAALLGVPDLPADLFAWPEAARR